MAYAPTDREPPIPPPPDMDAGDVFQRVVHAANVAYYVWRPDTNDLTISPGLLSLFGYDPETWTPQDFLDAMHPDDVGPYRAALRTHFKVGSDRMELTWRLLVPDGSYRWARELSMLERDSADRVICVTATVTDITEAKQREADLQAALDQQTAMSEILQAITASPGDLTPVFDTILEKALDLCDCAYGTVHTFDGEHFHTVGTRGTSPAMKEVLEQPQGITPGGAFARIAGGELAVHIADITADDAYRSGMPLRRAFADLDGARTALWVALRKENTVLGMIVVFRREVRPFTEQQINILKNFAVQAVIAMENARLLREQQEALERQTATAEVLAVINASQGDLTPVFDAILARAHRLCGATHGSLCLYDGALFRAVTSFGYPPRLMELVAKPFPGTRVRALIDGARYVHLPDVSTLAEAGPNEVLRGLIEIGHVRTMLQIPLRKEGTLLGFISTNRTEVRPFSDHEISLLESFAAQAVVAMENARLLEELRERTEALAQRNTEFGERIDQQNATIDVLKVMSTSPGDPQPVFDLIAERARAFAQADAASVITLDAETLNLRSYSGQFHDIANTYNTVFPRPVGPDSAVGRAVLTGGSVLIDDTETDHEYGLTRTSATIGLRAVVAVPMLRAGTAIGALTLARRTPGRFSEAQSELLRTFAEQAVIAITSAETYRELQARTEALAQRNSEFGERIEQQAATIDVLKVMSASPDDPQPVFQLIAERATEFCQMDGTSIMLVDDRMVHLQAIAGRLKEVEIEYGSLFPRPIDNSFAGGRAIRSGEFVEIEDLGADQTHSYRVLMSGLSIRSAAAIPMLRGGKPVGAITVGRTRAGKMSPAQVELLQTYAEQAVIAITSAENHRTLQARTAELARSLSEQQETLEQQKASAEILNVISTSVADPQPVFEKILESCKHLFSADELDILLVDEQGQLQMGAYLGRSKDLILATLPAPWEASPVAPAIRDRRVMHYPDVVNDPETPNVLRRIGEAGGFQSIVFAPMVWEKRGIGVVGVGRARGAFSDRELELLQGFADQAVIAIQNARMFREVREALEQQKSSAEILNVISTSVADPEPVFKKILESCTLLFGGDELDVLLVDDQGMLQVASYLGKATDIVLPTFPAPWEITPAAPAIRDLRVAHYPDVMNNPDTPRVLRRLGGAIGIHSMAFAPLIWEGRGIGVIGVARPHAAFADRDLAILQGFADQAVIAIQNARMFREVREARDNAESTLSDLRRAQDRLVQSEKMASLGQLTAGIAHEIKNPLNFVNNFSDLSADLLDELNEILGPVEEGVDAKLREEIEDLTTTLKGNLAKIAEHGRRADSIVKNMLAHSRTGASERRAVDLNATSDEALNLAYHGARAETPGFNITLDKQFDPNIGMVDLYPQEFTRVLVNLINNGFYAAHKRAATAGGGFEPILRLATRVLNGEVEIRVRDNGTGIPEEVRGKIFEPFFTTKPAGEGTGLGLSLSYDIIVKQHGGQLRVESELDSFTEFTITLPRRTESRMGETT